MSEFYRSTIGEIVAVIGAYAERERRESIVLVTSVIRALSSSLGGSQDPLQGLVDPEHAPRHLSRQEAKWKIFWRPTG